MSFDISNHQDARIQSRMNDNAHILVVDDQQEICDVVQEYLTGEGFTLADVTLAVQLLAMPGKIGVRVPDDCQNLARWLEQVYQRPSIRNTQPPETGLIQEVVARERT